MVVTKSKSSSNKANNNSNKPKPVSNTGVDKHKMWLIAGITFVILAVVFLVLFPSIKEGVAGKAIAGAPIGEELNLVPIKRNTGVLSSTFQLQDPLAKVDKLNTYVLFLGKDNDGNAVEAICLCSSVGAKGFSCPTYDTCTKTPEEAVADLNMELVAALTKSSTVQKKSDLTNLRKKATDTEKHLETLEEAAEDDSNVDAEEVAVALEAIKTMKLNLDINLAQLGSSTDSSTDTSTQEPVIDCNEDLPGVAYSPENAPENICEGTDGDSYVLLVGKGLGFRDVPKVKAYSLNGNFKTNYESGQYACEKQLNSVCVNVEKYENGAWAPINNEILNCGSPIFSTNYDLDAIYRASCGKVSLGGGSSSSSSGGGITVPGGMVNVGGGFQ